MPYHLATPHDCGVLKQRTGADAPALCLKLYGVDDGTRTRDNWNHNPVLYQLNYIHHIRGRREKKFFGTPRGTRTPGLLLRRQLLYPPELLARIGHRRTAPQRHRRVSG
ncbi:hypothetical protein KL86CLO1_10448 [uncultured Eubacteriales bacterium]|uniref:Uncharacterized protein n=1 Tax=uncultured Eubacteriales bacterium TaxID=172733 RepID=A0A212J469_9FIRM|nr:hypothetical protein KL86CLO1_10448 [uncultured Eubacteriales bacterium]